MNKIAITLIFSWICTLQALAGEPDKEFHEQCLYPTVMVVTELKSPDGHKSGSNGTGLIIKSEKSDGEKYDNFVITCCHVVVKENNSSIIVRKADYVNWSTFQSFADFNCDIVYQNTKADIAILYFESDEKMPIGEIDMKPELYIGNDVFRIGCGLSEIMKVDYGKITAVQHDMNELLKGGYRTSTPTIMGDSGGPAFHKTETGYKCFGLAQAVRGGQFESRIELSQGFLSVPIPYFVPHISFILPLNRVPDLLEKAQKKVKEKLEIIDLIQEP